LIARSPEVQRRLCAEVDAVVGRNKPAKPDHLPELKFTGQVITETLRLYPPAWLLTRVTIEDAQLDDYVLPAGTSVAYSPYLIHHHPECYPDSEVFDPDRWSPESAPNAPRNALIPFGGGARKCIGDNFGVREATLTLATIAARWQLLLANNRPIRPIFGAVLHPQSFSMRVRRRKALN
jgi:pentalenene oxygenase